MGTHAPSPLERLMDACIPEPMSGCWLWLGSVTADGYGQIYFWGKNWRAPRAAWTLLRGPIPPGALICHHCDNPLCINPDHLYVGTHTTNVHDCVRRGRHRPNKIPCHTSKNRGVANSNAKLNDDQVRAIRSVADRSRDCRQRLAREFGVSVSTIGQVQRGEKWRSVT